MLWLIQFAAIGLWAAGPQSGEAANLLERANTSYRTHRPADAVELYRDYLARYPDRADVRVFLGAALFNLGKPEEALAETTRALTYCHPKYYEGLPNTLYHNNGDGTFSDVSTSSGIGAHIGKGMSVAFADYDGDGRMDAFVTNDTERNFLFHNEGGGRFSEVGIRVGIAFNIDGKAVSSMGADFRDVDGDGRPDAVVTAISSESFGLFRNMGKGSFVDASYSSGLAALSLPWAGWGVDPAFSTITSLRRSAMHHRVAAECILVWARIPKSRVSRSDGRAARRKTWHARKRIGA